MSERLVVQKACLTTLCLGFLLFAQEQQLLDVQEDSTGSHRQDILTTATKDTSARQAEVADTNIEKRLTQEKKHKNIIGFGIGFSPASWIWIGDPVSVWANKDASAIFHILYERQVLQAVRLGCYFEYENATYHFNYYNNGDEFYQVSGNAIRYNWGINWLAQYPQNAFHAQLGGYLGYGFMSSLNLSQSPNGSSIQSLPGFDYGLMIGPAYETTNFGIALHLQMGFGYYNLSSGSPDEASCAVPRFILKIYYKI